MMSSALRLVARELAELLEEPVEHGFGVSLRATHALDDTCVPVWNWFPGSDSSFRRRPRLKSKAPSGVTSMTNPRSAPETSIATSSTRSRKHDQYQ